MVTVLLFSNMNKFVLLSIAIFILSLLLFSFKNPIRTSLLKVGEQLGIVNKNCVYLFNGLPGSLPPDSSGCDYSLELLGQIIYFDI